MGKTETYINVGRYRLPVHTKRDTKTGQLRYRVRLTKDIDTSGKRKDYDITDTTLEGLIAKAESVIHPYHYLMTPSHSQVLFNDMAERWFADGVVVWEDGTAQKYRRYLDRYILPFSKGCRLVEVDTEFLQGLFNRMVHAGTSPAVMREIKSRVRSILDYCVARRYLMTNPCEAIRMPKPVRNPQEALSYEQQRRLLQAFSRHPEDEGIVATLLYTGGRVSEVLGLTWDNVNEESGVLRFSNVLAHKTQDGRRVYYLRHHTKTRRARTILLSPTALSYFARQRAWQESMRRIAGNAWEEPIEGLVFTDALGRPIAYSSFEKRFKEVVTAMPDMEWVHPHTLRHTAASNYYHVTNDIVKVSEFLGHTNLYNTLRYTHSTYDDLRAVAEEMDHIHQASNAHEVASSRDPAGA